MKSKKLTKKAPKTRKTSRKKLKTTDKWTRLAERELSAIIREASKVAAIRKLGPKADWSVSVSLIGSAAMTRLNGLYRGKAYPTDVLSFHSPEVFQKLGQLGELVICLPTLKRQAKELGHPPEQELRVLLVHGLLHLLGEDHEKGAQASVRMAALEQKLLLKLQPGPSKTQVKGLIRRAE